VDVLAAAQAKGAEVETLVRRFNAEKATLEQAREAKAAEVEKLRAQLEEERASVAQKLAARNEEVAVLQASLDESIDMHHQAEEVGGDGGAPPCRAVREASHAGRPVLRRAAGAYAGGGRAKEALQGAAREHADQAQAGAGAHAG